MVNELIRWEIVKTRAITRTKVGMPAEKKIFCVKNRIFFKQDLKEWSDYNLKLSSECFLPTLGP
jgi:hypothetical protein